MPVLLRVLPIPLKLKRFDAAITRSPGSLATILNMSCDTQMPGMASVRQAKMVDLLGRLAPHAGYTLSALDEVRFLRADAPIARAPVMYEPSIVVVCQGTKRGFLGSVEYVYNAQQFLVLSVPLAFESETVASAAEPMLAHSHRSCRGSRTGHGA